MTPNYDDAALEQTDTPGLGEYLAILKRRKWQLLVPIVLVAPFAVATAMMLPPVYRASATILIEQQEVPPELIRTTVTSFADQRIQVIKQRVMTVKNLGEVIDKFGLYEDIRRKKSLNAAVAEMRGRIDLDMISAQVVDPRSGSAKKATIAFSLSFSDSSPTATQRVTNELVSLFMAENLRQREAAVEEASLFLREESERLADEIRALEASLADFKQRHSDNLPELFSTNREFLGRAEEKLRDTEMTLRTLKEQKLYLETELAQLDPQLTLATGGDRQAAASPAARLQSLEAQYAGVISRFSPSHPARRQMEREMAALRKQVGRGSTAGLKGREAELEQALALARQRYADAHPQVQQLERQLEAISQQIAAAGDRTTDQEQSPAAADNPAYVHLKTSLEATKVEIATLSESREAIKEQIAVYEQRLHEAPNIERQYRNLTRGYDNAVAKYREVKDKQLEAELAQSLELKRKAERFTLIEPPVVPGEPVEPNRPAIMLLGLVGAVGSGVGHLVVRELLDKGLHTANALRVIIGAPPLAVIPYIPLAAERRRRKRRNLILAGAGASALILAVVLVHVFMAPIDLLWFRLLGKLTA